MRIYRRGARGTWWVDFKIPGQPRFTRSSLTTDEAAAREWAAKAHSDQWRQRRLGAAPTVTWDEAALAWLEQHQDLRSIEDIKRVLRWLTDRLTGKPLAAIDDAMVGALAAERRKMPVNRRAIAAAVKAGRKPPAPIQTKPATVNRFLAQLSAVLHFAHRRRWLAAMPIIELADEPAQAFHVLTPDEESTLLDELPAHLAAMARFSLATGLRESNVRLLEWSRVDLQRAVAWVLPEQAKGKRAIPVPLSPAALAVLARQRGINARWVFPAPRWLKKKRPEDKPQLVLDAPTGKVCNHAWRKACIRAGVPTLRFHDLRHTWATRHTLNATPSRVLQDLGGWASAQMLERYTHMAVPYTAKWAGGSALSAATVRQPAAASSHPDPAEVQKAFADQEVSLGWLMGLEPTTTGITIGDGHTTTSRIKHLRTPKKPKAA
jgi:integrase